MDKQKKSLAPASDVTVTPTNTPETLRSTALNDTLTEKEQNNNSESGQIGRTAWAMQITWTMWNAGTWKPRSGWWRKLRRLRGIRCEYQDYFAHQHTRKRQPRRVQGRSESPCRAPQSADPFPLILSVDKGMRLRAHQRAFRSPFGNLRGRPVYDRLWGPKTSLSLW